MMPRRVVLGLRGVVPLPRRHRFGDDQRGRVGSERRVPTETPALVTPDVRRRYFLNQRPVGVQRRRVFALEHVRRALFAPAPFVELWIVNLLDPLRAGSDDQHAVANRQPALAKLGFASHLPVGPPPLRVDHLDPFKLGREVARRFSNKDVHAGALRRVNCGRLPDVRHILKGVGLVAAGADDYNVVVHGHRLPEERLFADEREPRFAEGVG
mmetsp:Transcript_12839/g.50221  ORF Transcript_12839/g.50221 Transcript_12839/m.50221 type:complete len:212 (-) Transcript_12839:1151-1786(-)